MPLASLDEIRAKIGQEVGVSSWIEVDQRRIDAFADATDDRQFIHTDPEAAARTPFGGTIAHGFLSLSLLSRMAADAMLVPDIVNYCVNYGLDRVRFLAPVRAGYVHATARALHKGRRTIVVDTDLRDDEGRLVARVTQTQAALGG